MRSTTAIKTLTAVKPVQNFTLSLSTSNQHFDRTEFPASCDGFKFSSSSIPCEITLRIPRNS